MSLNAFLFFSDVWAAALLLWLRAEAPNRGNRLLLRQLRVQAAVQPEVPLQWADAGAQHVCRRHRQEDERVPFSPAWTGAVLQLTKTAYEKLFTPCVEMSFMFKVVWFILLEQNPRMITWALGWIKINDLGCSSLSAFYFWLLFALISADIIKGYIGPYVRRNWTWRELTVHWELNNELLVPKEDFAFYCVPIFKIPSKLIAQEALLRNCSTQGSVQVIKPQSQAC